MNKTLCNKSIKQDLKSAFFEAVARGNLAIYSAASSARRPEGLSHGERRLPWDGNVQEQCHVLPTFATWLVFSDILLWLIGCSIRHHRNLVRTFARHLLQSYNVIGQLLKGCQHILRIVKMWKNTSEDHPSMKQLTGAASKSTPSDRFVAPVFSTCIVLFWFGRRSM